MSASQEKVLSSPPRHRRSWRSIAVIGTVVVLLATLMIWLTIGENNREQRADKDAAHRTRVVMTALDKLTLSTRGAITLQGTIDGHDWKNGQIRAMLTVGNCHDVTGYVEVELQPTEGSWGVMHILVPGHSTNTPPADVRIITDTDLFLLKRTLNDTDSGLRHCVVGNVRLFPVSG